MGLYFPGFRIFAIVLFIRPGVDLFEPLEHAFVLEPDFVRSKVTQDGLLLDVEKPQRFVFRDLVF